MLSPVDLFRATHELPARPLKNFARGWRATARSALTSSARSYSRAWVRLWPLPRPRDSRNVIRGAPRLVRVFMSDQPSRSGQVARGARGRDCDPPGAGGSRRIAVGLTTAGLEPMGGDELAADWPPRRDVVLNVDIARTSPRRPTTSPTITSRCLMQGRQKACLTVRGWTATRRRRRRTPPRSPGRGSWRRRARGTRRGTARCSASLRLTRNLLEAEVEGQRFAGQAHHGIA